MMYDKLTHVKPKWEVHRIVTLSTSAVEVGCYATCRFQQPRIERFAEMPSEELTIFCLTCQINGSSSVTLDARKKLRVTVCDTQVMALAIMAPLMEKGSMV